jgi:hypothetical protein
LPASEEKPHHDEQEGEVGRGETVVCESCSQHDGEELWENDCENSDDDPFGYQFDGQACRSYRGPNDVCRGGDWDR